VALVADLARFIVAFTFLFSAFWKARHSAAFTAVIAGAARRRLPAWSSRMGPLVALLEVVVAIGLLLGYPEIWISSLVAATFLIAFSVFLARADSLANGCGCWEPVRRGDASAAPFLVRNAVLIVLAAIGATQQSTLGIAPQAAVAAIALLPAWLVMEIPTVLELLRPGGAKRVATRLGAER
jgi:hypothetical protein